MREIKFRAWNKETKKMIAPEEICRLHYSDGTCYCIMDWDEGIHFAKKIVLLQYTGLHDKNGKEIYEGDIVDNGMNHTHSRGNVFICAKGVMVHAFNDPDSPMLSMALTARTHGGKVEIIGNIYENPELLKTEYKQSEVK